MKVLFITQYFYPENFRGNDICFYLANAGYDVTVLTGIPNYPEGRFFKGYGLFQKRKEIIQGIKVIRVPIIPRGKNSTIKLVLNYFSYAVVASVYSLWWGLTKKFDKIIVQQLSPVLISAPAILFKKVQRKTLYTWVLDLWPESLSSAGGIKNKFVLKFFDWFVKWEYQNSDKILISSLSFESSIIAKGDYKHKIIYFPNWAEDVFILDAKNFDLPKLPKGFRIMFAGNIGEAQDFNHIMETVYLLKNDMHIKFIIIGDGRKKKWVDDYISKHHLEQTVTTLGRYPIEYMPCFFREADAMLVTLKDELIFKLTAPAKLQAYMSSSKPILGMISGEAADIINKAKCGYCVNAGDSEGLAKIIREMAALTNEKLIELGNNGKVYCDQFFNKEKCMKTLVNIIEHS